MKDIFKNKLTHHAGSVQKSDISDKVGDSSPVFGTKKVAFSEKIRSLFDESLEVWHQTVAERYPFKLARLIHHRYNMRKRWYILFYAWDVSTNSLKRYRMFEPLNRIKNKTQRIEQAEAAILIINSQLRAGKVFGKDKAGTINTTINPTKLTLIKAVDFVKEQKTSDNYYFIMTETGHTFEKL